MGKPCTWREPGRPAPRAPPGIRGTGAPPGSTPVRTLLAGRWKEGRSLRTKLQPQTPRGPSPPPSHHPSGMTGTGGGRGDAAERGESIRNLFMASGFLNIDTDGRLGVLVLAWSQPSRGPPRGGGPWAQAGPEVVHEDGGEEHDAEASEGPPELHHHLTVHLRAGRRVARGGGEVRMGPGRVQTGPFPRGREIGRAADGR